LPGEGHNKGMVWRSSVAGVRARAAHFLLHLRCCLHDHPGENSLAPQGVRVLDSQIGPGPPGVISWIENLRGRHSRNFRITKEVSGAETGRRLLSEHKSSAATASGGFVFLGSSTRQYLCKTVWTVVSGGQGGVLSVIEIFRQLTGSPTYNSFDEIHLWPNP
jgi:hypothetical protein